MKTRWSQFARTLSLVAVTAAFPGCFSDNEADGTPAEATSEDSEMAAEGEQVPLGTAQQGAMSCANPDGTNAAMAAFAVAVSKELGRWQAGKDFVKFKTNEGSETSGTGQSEAIKLASGSDASGPIGKSRCADGKCANVQALLDMQYKNARWVVFFQGSGSTKVELVPSALRSRMVSKWDEQRTYDGRARDGVADQAPVEEHKLAFVSAAKGGCDTNFTFQATKTNGAALQYVNQLKYKLVFADIQNPYISFTNLGGGKVSIDPTWGLNEDGTSTGGTCAAACTKITATSVAGQCCSCGGVTKSFVKSAYNAVTYLCQ